MMGKKDLDKMFQEKFTDFHELPDEKVWERLETSLDKKEKNRKVIPIWWKLGGTAAVFALLFIAIHTFDNETEENPVITDTENTRSIPVDKNKEQEGALDANKTELTNTDSPSNVKDVQNNSEVNTQNSSVKQKENYTTIEAVVTTKTSKEKVSDKTQANKNKLSNNTNQTIVANNEVSNDKAQIDLKKKKETILIDKGLDTNNAIAETEINSDKIEKEVIKKSILDEIEEEEKEAIASIKTDKWSVGASVAPVYFNTLNDGSPIHQNFVDNSKSGNVNMSYGLSVAYKVGKKLSIRSGINKVDYGYNTSDVVYTSTYDQASNSIINSIDYEANGANIIVESKEKRRAESFASDFSAKTPTNEGEMIQQFGYLEVPVELNYAITDGKFGVNIIGGFSSLFLIDNSISLESGNLKTDIGEANNINSLNFSTNVGLGLNYKVTNKVRINVEPVFKYQLNTFSDSSGNFQPFSMGVYSGLSFKF